MLYGILFGSKFVKSVVCLYYKKEIEITKQMLASFISVDLKIEFIVKFAIYKGI